MQRDAEKDRRDREKSERQQQYGAPPSGYERITVEEPQEDGTTKESFVDRPMRGSKPYIDMYEGSSAVRRGVDNMEKMIDLIDKHGTEAIGETSATMRGLYGDILAAVAEAQNKGVLQQGELEEMKEQLPNPGEWKSLRLSNDRIKAAFVQKLEQIRDKLNVARNVFEKEWRYTPPADIFGEKLPKGARVDDQGRIHLPPR